MIITNEMKQEGVANRQAVVDSMSKILCLLCPEAKWEFVSRTKYNIDGTYTTVNRNGVFINHCVADNKKWFNRYCYMFFKVLSKYHDKGLKLFDYSMGNQLSGTVRYGMKDGPVDYYNADLRID